MMTPQQALAYLEGQIAANSPLNCHIGPQNVYVVAQEAFGVIRAALEEKSATVKPKTTKPKQEQKR